VNLTNWKHVTHASNRLFIQAPSSPCFALATKRRRPRSGDRCTAACPQVSLFLQHFFSIAEMRNRLAAAEALNGYLRVRLHRLQQKDCSSGGVCSSSGGSSMGGYSSSSNEPSIDKCRASSSQQGGESSTGSHELWSVSCSNKSVSHSSNDSFLLNGGEGPGGVVAVMSSHGKSVLLS
jgi:hypothetical protein